VNIFPQLLLALNVPLGVHVPQVGNPWSMTWVKDVDCEYTSA